MARLIIREGPARGTAYELLDDVTILGRDPANTIQIPSETVSRSHAEVVRVQTDDEVFWEVRDRKSKNGVVLNGKRASKARLASGDNIKLGDVVLAFVERDFDTMESKDLADAGEPLVMRDTLRGDTIAIGPGSAPVLGGADPRKTLLALLELSRLAGAASSCAELCAAVTAAVEQNLQPHRTVPILFDEHKGLLRPWLSQKGEFDRHLASIPISSTIVNYVRDKRAAILSETAQQDRRLRNAQSIATHQITSAMCAPMMIGDHLIGAVYADRLGDAERFTKSDLELLTAFAAQAAVVIESVRAREEVAHERFVHEREARGQYDIIGQSEVIEKVFHFIAKAAPTDSGVLIEGESGTGKELVARAIHLNSSRRHKAFEAVNCAAMAPSLLESELFGHVRGAFTGADRDRPGRFELADEGTLFLDEIGELPDSSQSKLLRVMETGEIRRLGDVKDRKVNVRIVAATNKNLAEEMAGGRFREDLYFRLNVLKISLPPLRERGPDVRLLADHFLRHFEEKCGRPRLKFDETALQMLASYSWPGNVREMKNAIERMVVMAEGEVLTVEDIPYDIRRARGTDDAPIVPDDAGTTASLRDVERRHIERVLREAAGNKKETARILGIDRSTLYAKLKAYEIDFGED